MADSGQVARQRSYPGHEGHSVPPRRGAGRAETHPQLQPESRWYKHFRPTHPRELDVQYLLGHSSPMMVRRYSATYDSEQAASAHASFSPAIAARWSALGWAGAQQTRQQMRFRPTSHLPSIPSPLDDRAVSGFALPAVPCALLRSHGLQSDQRRWLKRLRRCHWVCGQF